MISRKLLIVPFLLLLSFSLFALGCKQTAANDPYSPFPKTEGIITEQVRDDWGWVTYKEKFVVVNNVWNKGAATGPYRQRVFLETLDGKEAFGWQWIWPDTSNAVVSYPEVIYGDKPWDEPSHIKTEFPLQAGSADITANFKIIYDAEGICNIAFSLWGITDMSNIRGSITHEIMIWNINQGMYPAGKKTYELRVNNTNFDVYVFETHSDSSGENPDIWIYIAFAPTEPIISGPLKIHTFIDFLIEKGLLSSDNYLTSVELGTEVVSGKGTVEIENYSLTITPRL